MSTNVVRQPIMSSDKSVIGYELRYQDNEVALYSRDDSVAAGAIENFLTQLDSEKFLGEAIAFITFTPNLLIRNIPRFFQPGRLVIQVEDNTVVHPQSQQILSNLRNQGYKIAVSNFEFSPRYFALLDIIDYIKVDMEKADMSTNNIINIGKSFDKKVVAVNVNSHELYKKAIAAGCTLFQGSAVAAAMSSVVPRMDHLKSNFFQLMIAVTRDEPDVDEITEIISRDVTLAFSVIKMVNSAYFALRNRVRSVKQALVVLGLGQLKQWVYLLSFRESDGDMSSELIKISFLRASFCSELAVFVKNTHIAKSDAYLMGMFSTLGLLMEVPLELAIAELPVVDEVRSALITREGPYAPLYELILSYENADWSTMASCAEKLGLSQALVSQKYFECVEYVNNIWETLLNPYKEETEQEDE